MPTQYTDSGVPYPEFRDDPYHPALIAALQTLAGFSPVLGLSVRPTLYTSAMGAAGLSVQVNPGVYARAGGQAVAYAGGTYTAPPSATTCLWLDDATAALVGGAAWPPVNHVPLAVLVAGATALTSWADARVAAAAAAPASFATAAGQAVAFYGGAPVAQPAGAAQAAITDSTGGTPAAALATVGNTSTGDQSGVLNNNLATLAQRVNALLAALGPAGLNLIKGGA